MPADRGDLYILLPSSSAEGECSYLFFVPTLLKFTYFGGLLLHGSAEDIRRVFILAISEFPVLTAVNLFVYAAEEAALDYYVGLLRFDHVGDGMLFRLLIPLVNNLSHCSFYKVA